MAVKKVAWESVQSERWGTNEGTTTQNGKRRNILTKLRSVQRDGGKRQEKAR